MVVSVIGADSENEENLIVMVSTLTGDYDNSLCIEWYEPSIDIL